MARKELLAVFPKFREFVSLRTQDRGILDKCIVIDVLREATAANIEKMSVRDLCKHLQDKDGTPGVRLKVSTCASTMAYLKRYCEAWNAEHPELLQLEVRNGLIKERTSIKSSSRSTIGGKHGECISPAFTPEEEKFIAHEVKWLGKCRPILPMSRKLYLESLLKRAVVDLMLRRKGT